MNAAYVTSALSTSAAPEFPLEIQAGRLLQALERGDRAALEAEVARACAACEAAATARDSRLAEQSEVLSSVTDYLRVSVLGRAAAPAAGDTRAAAKILRHLASN